jgi:hypothetical protein
MPATVKVRGDALVRAEPIDVTFALVYDPPSAGE